MTPHEFEREFVKLCALRGTTQVTHALKDLWYNAVCSLPDHAWRKAVDRWCHGNNRFPTVAEIKALANPLTRPTDYAQAPEPELTQEERAINRIAGPLFIQLLDRKISHDQFVALLKEQLTTAGLDHCISWTSFDTQTTNNQEASA